MNRIKSLFKDFSREERLLWLFSLVFIALSFVIFDRENYMALLASLVGVTSLIFGAKGNPIGPLLSIIFSLIYGIISFSCRYFGEVILYWGITAPMSFVSLVAWLKNPYNGKRNEVKVNKISGKEIFFMSFFVIAVTVLFYFILKCFGTENLYLSTFSVTVSFAAIYLTFRRSPYFAIVYAVNDIVLIALWTLAAAKDISYISVVICFIVFLVNDIYGFINWRRIFERQQKNSDFAN